MRLAEFLQNLFQTIGGTGLNGEFMLTHEILNMPQIKEQLLKCEEFENTKEIIVLENPVAVLEIDGKEKIYSSSTLKLYEGVRFKERVYLYSIFLAPNIFDVQNLTHPVKDDICVTPVYWNEGFVPKQIISVFVQPELLQDMEVLGKEDLKEKIIENFKKALDNPNEYLIKGKRPVMMRFIHEESVEHLEEGSLNGLQGMYVEV